jgi:hypothetical protein
MVFLKAYHSFREKEEREKKNVGLMCHSSVHCGQERPLL